MTIDELFETIEIEWQFECQEMGYVNTDFERLQDFIVEEVLENWNLGVDQRRVVVETYELPRGLIFPFYVIDGGKK